MESELSVGIRKLKNKKYHLTFVRKGINTELKPENIMFLGAPSPDLLPEKIFVESYDNLNFVEIYDKIKSSFLPVMKKTGFYALLDILSYEKILSN